jgi:UDP-N-acetylglucosamine acyltransferase
MKDSQIHQTALVSGEAKLGENTSVGAYAIIEPGAVIGKGCCINSHAVIKSHAVIRDQVEVGHFSVIGGDPQYLSFDRSIPSKVVIGEGTRIGEGVTVHRSIEKDGITSVGGNCFLMGACHIAHDCVLEKKAVLANGVLLGGHVLVGSESFLGGGAAVHQFVRIGSGSMVGGLAEISLDVAPQVLVSGRNHISGLNLVGLKRRGISQADLSELKKCFRLLFEQNNLPKAAMEILNSGDFSSSEMARDFLRFFTSGKRGFARYSKKAES